MEGIRLFDIVGSTVVPTEHCYTLTPLKRIMDLYPHDYLAIYQYVFYMTCPNPKFNPFFNIPSIDKEEVIMNNIDITGEGFSIEDDEIISALELCTRLYDTPTSRAYKGISTMLDNLATYMATTTVEHGRDGNITALVNAAAKFEMIRGSFKGAYKDLMDEQKGSVRGGTRLGYDQL